MSPQNESRTKGYVEDKTLLKSWCKEADKYLNQLKMPFCFVMDNHDVNLDASQKVWFDRVGAKRGYSHFIYKDVLFLQLSTENPQKYDPGPDLGEKHEQVKTGNVDPQVAATIVVELETWAGQVNISDAQVEYFKKVLAANPRYAGRWSAWTA